MNVEEYLNQLNESQREAVVYNEGPSLVVAGAGSGKTRVLTYKIAYLLQLGLPPYSILALTFTNKAAREMKERIAAITGEQTARRLWMGTFHSIFSRILRNEAEHIGYPSNFTIYDATDSKSLLKSIIKEMQLDDKVYRLGMVQSRISNAKNSLITYTAYEQNKELVESQGSLAPGNLQTLPEPLPASGSHGFRRLVAANQYPVPGSSGRLGEIPELLPVCIGG